MIRNYLKSIFCQEERVNRLQVDVSLTDVKQIRRVIHMLHDAIPEEERFFPPDFFSKGRATREVAEPFVVLLDEDHEELMYRVNRRTHQKLFEVFDYLHAHPTEIDTFSARKLEELTGVSKSHCNTALVGWRNGIDGDYASYLERENAVVS